MNPAEPGAAGTTTAFPPSPVSYTRGSGADITTFVVLSIPASLLAAKTRHVKHRAFALKLKGGN